MTITTTTSTDERPKKQVWVRCKGSGNGDSNGCRQRVYNDPIDVEQHRQHCPADLERTVKDLERRLILVETVGAGVPDLDSVSDDWPAPDPTPAGPYAGGPAEAAADVEDPDFDDEHAVERPSSSVWARS